MGRQERMRLGTALARRQRRRATALDRPQPIVNGRPTDAEDLRDLRGSHLPIEDTLHDPPAQVLLCLGWETAGIQSLVLHALSYTPSAQMCQINSARISNIGQSAPATPGIRNNDATVSIFRVIIHDQNDILTFLHGGLLGALRHS